MSEYTVSFVIPNYNGTAYLEKLIRSILSQGIKQSQITIIDDCSTDNSVGLITYLFPDINLIINKNNLGFAKSANKAISTVDSKFICLLNNDVWLCENWLSEALKPFYAHKNVGCVATNILVAGTDNIIDTQGDDYFKIGVALKRNNLTTDSGVNNNTVRVFAACAAAVVYDNDILTEIGAFDEFFDSYCEDVDLSFRINLYGRKIIYAPAAKCYHHVSASYKGHNNKMTFNTLRNEEIVFWSNMPKKLLIKNIPCRLIFLLMQMFVKLFKSHFLIFIKAKIDFLRNIKYVIDKRRYVQSLINCSTEEIESVLKKDWISVFINRKFK